MLGPEKTKDVDVMFQIGMFLQGFRCPFNWGETIVRNPIFKWSLYLKFNVNISLMWWVSIVIFYLCSHILNLYVENRCSIFLYYLWVQKTAVCHHWPRPYPANLPAAPLAHWYKLLLPRNILSVSSACMKILKS